MRLTMPLVKIDVDVSEVKTLIKQLKANRSVGLAKLAQEVKQQTGELLNQLMQMEFSLFLGDANQRNNKRNGYKEREYALKGVGTVKVRIPRDRNSSFDSAIIPRHERMDPRLREDIAILHLAGISNRTLALISRRLLGISVGKDLVNSSLGMISEQAEAWLTRDLSHEKYWALFIDGTNFKIRRQSGVDKEPSLVVLGISEQGYRSILAVEPGYRDSSKCWQEVFKDLARRGLDVGAVQVGIMDGLPGLEKVFQESFLNAITQRCWIHSKRNALSKTPKRLSEAYSLLFNRVMYAQSEQEAREAFSRLKESFDKECRRAVAVLEKDLESLLNYYHFPENFWHALRTTNAIERVNKELKRRVKSMETVSAKSHVSLLAFTALRLEIGWRRQKVNSSQEIALAKKSRQRVLGEESAMEIKAKEIETVVAELGIKH